MAKTEEHQKAIVLRKEGHSINRIAEILNVSKGSISSWCKHINMTDEQKSTLYRKNALHASHSMSKKFKERREAWQEQGRTDAANQNPDFFALCMLFWAEGSKRTNELIITNCDPLMIKFYLNCLRRYFKINENEIYIRLRLHLGNGKTIDEILSFWKKYLSITDMQIKKVDVKQDKRENPTKKNIHLYGNCQLLVYNTEIVQRLYGGIQGFVNKF